MNVAAFLAGTTGRAVRAAAGIAMIAIGATAGGAWWILAAAGLLPLAAGVFDFCLIGPLMRMPLTGTAFRRRLAPPR
ncbi:DUF2892 domain-containing protein [Streptomyces sp. NBC_00704]|uniref:YgaP-like transmembrane domain n=1 Tax=Streptomyces sp. NBC_00704 TaxID=2975809 RepID=UPI002E3493B0|nr:YgaP-like transmembrane domain [Streptomyces sp. NBC_00704]